MMKINNIYPEIISKENLYRSAYMASRGRRYRDSTADFNFSLEEEIGRLHKELLTKTYRHGKYRLFTIYDPKERNIAAAPFRDRVVHHAVHDVIEPIIDKSFIYDSYACRKGKGTHKAVDRAQGFERANKFCFHGDIKQYFPSINHRMIKRILRMRIEDRDTLWLLDEIIDSAVSLQGVKSQAVFANPPKAGEAIPEGGVATAVCDSLAMTDRSCTDNEIGLPIGNLTSQFLANLYLNELDYFIKFDLRIKHYLRYMDDFLIFSNEKIRLVEVKERIREFLSGSLELRLHKDKSQIYSTSDGIKFLGFRLFSGYRRLASDNLRRFKKRLKMFAYLLEKSGEWRVNSGEKTSYSSLTTLHSKIRDSVRCWTAHSCYANSKTLRFQIWKRLADKEGRMGILLKDILLDSVTAAKRSQIKEKVTVQLSEAFRRDGRVGLNLPYDGVLLRTELLQEKRLK